MRLVRFSGAYEKHFWPVGMHTLLVADLLPEELQVDGLLHDGEESCGGDVPRPFKTGEHRSVMAPVTKRLYAHLGLKLPSKAARKLIHVADMRAVNVEGTFGCGPRGYPQTQTNYSIDQQALKALDFYLTHPKFDFDNMLRADGNGYWPLLFEKRLREAIRRRTHEDSHSMHTG
jgi:hypothetical protein